MKVKVVREMLMVRPDHYVTDVMFGRGPAVTVDLRFLIPIVEVNQLVIRGDAAAAFDKIQLDVHRGVMPAKLDTPIEIDETELRFFRRMVVPMAIRMFDETLRNSLEVGAELNAVTIGIPPIPGTSHHTVKLEVTFDFDVEICAFLRSKFNLMLVA